MKEFLYFTGVWCQPCQQLGPIMNKISQQMPVRKIDVDVEPNIAQQKGVRSVPTVILVKNGVEVTRVVGVHPESYYIQMFNKF
jgi:thioredoxin 1